MCRTFSQQLLFLLLFVIQYVMNCPDACSCKWKSGKEWVECANRGLQELPQGAREETQVLDLSGNQLFTLAADTFFNLQLVNLQRLYLSRSQIQYVAARAFKGLQGLVELDLSENNIEQVTMETFLSVNNLMRINLSGNSLKIIRRNTFSHLKQLNFLDLSHCRLIKIESGAFAGLQALEWLRLNDNLLTSISEAILPLTGNLRGLPLHGNPWLCDCQLIAMHEWLQISQTQVPQEVDPSCAEPDRLQTRLIRELKRQELACVPIITLIEQPGVYEGDNVTLRCEVQAIPQAIIMWLLNGETFNEKHVLAKYGRIRYRYSEDQNDTTIIMSLDILSIAHQDEGIYSCQAENAAGTASSNLTLRILHREHNTVAPPVDNAGFGYAIAIATGALFGTLLALGCLFLGIFFYTRRLHIHSKNNLHKSSLNSSLVPPSIIKKNTMRTYDKSQIIRSSNTSTVGGFIPTDDAIHTSECCLEAEQVAESNKIVKFTCVQNQQMPQRFIEPDLINEVSTVNDSSTPNIRQFCQLYFEPHSSCLDNDGYPLNFGLPKLDLNVAPMCTGNVCKTSPRIRQHQRLLTHESPVLPFTRYSYDSEFLSRNIYVSNSHPILQIGYTTTNPTTLLYSSTADSQSEVPSSSSRLFLQAKTKKEGTEKVQNSEYMNNSELTPHSLIKSCRNINILEHSESPDEGYVGDAMDV